MNKDSTYSLVLMRPAFILPAVAFAAWAVLAPCAFGGPKVDYGVDATTRAKYTSNLYNVPEVREDLFDEERGVGQRFDGMEGPEDFEFKTEATLFAKWRFAKKQHLRLSAGAGYSWYLDNSIADYLALDGAFRLDVTDRDELKFSVAYIPDRFKKNYKVSRMVDGQRQSEYEHAYYSQIETSVRYKRAWHDRLSTGVEYTYADRAFDGDSFQGRDREVQQVLLLVGTRVGSRLEVELGAGYAEADSAVEIMQRGRRGQRSFERDRSFEEFLAEVKLTLDLPRKWWVTLEADFSSKDYTTDLLDDALYYNRADETWGGGLKVKKELSKRLAIFADASYNETMSNREPSEEGDDEEVEYRKYTLGGGVEVNF